MTWEPDRILPAACPTCGHAERLAHFDYDRAGRRRKSDPTSATWNVRCDECRTTYSVAYDLRYYERREFGRSTLYKRPVGTPIYFGVSLPWHGPVRTDR